jgi:hypothetical protein
MQMAVANGVKDVYSPRMVPSRMQEQGIDIGDAYWKTLGRFAKQASDGSNGDLVLGTEKFMLLCESMGVSLGSWDDAHELYKSLVEEGNPTGRASSRRAQAAADPGTIGEQVGNLFSPLKSPGNLLAAGGKLLSGNLSGSWDSLKAAGRNFTSFGDQMGKYFASPEDILADAQRRSAPPPATGKEMADTRIRTEGNVQGEVRIVVDQNGRVTAPASVTLTGQQRGVNAGYGTGTMNSPSPGDPNFNHSAPFLGGGK